MRPDEDSRQHGASTAPEQRLVFSARCGRLRLSNVVVRNAGIEWADSSNVYWRHKVRTSTSTRHDLCVGVDPACGAHAGPRGLLAPGSAYLMRLVVIRWLARRLRASSCMAMRSLRRQM